MHHNWLFWTAFHLCIISFICIIINSFDSEVRPTVMKQSNVYIPHTCVHVSYQNDN